MGERWDDGVDLSPDPAVLAHLRSLVERLGLVTASRLKPLTEAERHRLVHGHSLSYGCCRAGSALEAPAGASTTAVEAEACS